MLLFTYSLPCVIGAIVSVPAASGLDFRSGFTETKVKSGTSQMTSGTSLLTSVTVEIEAHATP